MCSYSVLCAVSLSIFLLNGIISSCVFTSPCSYMYMHILIIIRSLINIVTHFCITLFCYLSFSLSLALIKGFKLILARYCKWNELLGRNFLLLDIAILFDLWECFSQPPLSVGPPSDCIYNSHWLGPNIFFFLSLFFSLSLLFRARTMKVYSMFSKKPLPEVKQNLLDLKADFVILENSWCVRRQK